MYAGFTDSKVTVQDMNVWNRDHRFARGYIDTVGDPCLEMDIDLDEGGMSSALFQDHIEVWANLLATFKQTIYPE